VIKWHENFIKEQWSANYLINLYIHCKLIMNRTFFFIFLSIILIFSKNASAQRGKNGAKTVTAVNTIVNEYTVLTADAASGSASVTVASNTLNNNNRFGTGNILAAGDLIFIIQMQGASMQGGQWWAGYGYISDYNNAGLYEFAQVSSVQGTNIINLSCGLLNSYTATGKVQVVRVPRYTTLTVNNGAVLTSDPWDGNKGGVLVIENLNNIDINGNWDVSGKGFRGGNLTEGANQTSIPYYCTTDSTYGAKKGEGIAGGGLADGKYGRGAPANGGGGGNAHNAGGGGGSNTSNSFAWNGCGFPDTTTNANYIQAWDLETTPTVPSGVPFHKNASYGGGRGGYTFSGQDQDALTIPPFDSLWGGDMRRTYGGLGGWPLFANNNNKARLFMGGGGGAGSQNDGWGGAGGNGGGIIYIMSYDSVSGTGNIISDGNDGGNSAGTPPWNGHAGVDGAGGAGGGGAVVINAVGTITSISVEANGGNGGTIIKSKGIAALPNDEAEGPGGGGGGGYIAISNGSINRITKGGVNGTVTAIGIEGNGVSEFPPNGATKGGPGVNNAVISNFTFTANNVFTCKGQADTLIANLTGSLPAGTFYGWYTSEFGNTEISDSLSLIIADPQTTTVYYFGTCPGTYRIPVTLTVPSANANAGPDTILCRGTSITLNASGGIIYSWFPSNGLSNPNIPNPVCNTDTNILYTLEVTDTNGCHTFDSIRVTASSYANATITAHGPLCENANPITLNSAESGGSWSGPGITNPATGLFNPAVSGSGNIQITYSIPGMCGNADTTNILINPLPVVSLGNDTILCQGQTQLLNAGNPGSGYLWTNSTVNQTLSVTSSGLYWVEVTDSNSCSFRDSINVSVIPYANATINGINPVCSNISPFDLTAAQSGGNWTGNGIINNINGTFSPSAAFTGINIITYTISGVCGNYDTTHISVLPSPLLSADTISPGCPDYNNGKIILHTSGGTLPFTYLWSNGSNVDSIIHLENGTYTVTVTDLNNCKESKTILFNVPLIDCFSPVVYVPNIFSPNGDGQNDNLFVRGQGIKSLDFIIYDRWGEKVFETNDQTQFWDGTFKGKDMPVGVYSYHLKALMNNDKKIEKKGNISLVR